MNSFERLHRVIQGQPVDRTPVTPILMQFAAKHIAVPYRQYATDHRTLVEGYLRCWQDFGFDQVSVISDPFREAADLGANVMFPQDGVPLCKDALLKNYADAKKLPKISPYDGPRMADRLRGVELFEQEVGGQLSICGWVEGPIAEFVDLRGMTAAMMDFLDAPDFFHEVAAVLVDLAAEFAAAQSQAGADVIGVGDAAASLISADVYESMVLPWEQKLFERIHEAGALVKLHICGDTTRILEDIVDIGPNCFSLESKVDLNKAKDVLGGKVCVAGNVAPTDVFFSGTPEEVIQEAQACVDTWGEGGGYLLTLGCDFPKTVPLANVMALMSFKGQEAS